MMTQSGLIDALGGGARIADLLSEIHVDGPFDEGERKKLRDRIYKWKVENSIPWRWRPWMRRLASEAGLTIPAELRDPAEAA